MKTMPISDAIVEGLKKKRIKQSELASSLGVNQSTVSMWVSGKNVPPGDKLIRIAEILDIQNVLFPESRSPQGNLEYEKRFEDMENKFLELESRVENLENAKKKPVMLSFSNQKQKVEEKAFPTSKAAGQSQGLKPYIDLPMGMTNHKKMGICFEKDDLGHVNVSFEGGDAKARKAITITIGFESGTRETILGKEIVLGTTRTIDKNDVEFISYVDVKSSLW